MISFCEDIWRGTSYISIIDIKVDAVDINED